MIGGILVLFIYITRQALNKIFLPSNKTHQEVGQAKDLSTPLQMLCMLLSLEGICLSAVWEQQVSTYSE